MSAVFPLFRLSFLPLKNVFDIMDLGDLTILSVCSEKTRIVMTAANKKVSFNYLTLSQRFKLNTLEEMALLRAKIESEEPIPNSPIITNIKVSDFVTITISRGSGGIVNIFSLSVRVECINQKNQYEGTNGFLKIGGITVPVVMSPQQIMVTFWEDQSEGIHCLINYFKTIFHSQNTDCSVYGKREQKFSQNLKTAVKGMAQQSILKCVVNNGLEIEFDDYQLILENFKPTLRYESIGYQVENIEHKSNFNSQYLKVNPAKWFTIDNLLTTNCENIDLYETQVTNDDMKEYLRQWMAGRFTKLKHLKVELRDNVDLEYIISGLPGYSKSRRKYRGKNGYEIVRGEDGTISINRQGKPTAEISIPCKYLDRIFVLHIL